MLYSSALRSVDVRVNKNYVPVPRVNATFFRIENFLDLKIIFTIEWIDYFRRLKRLCFFLNIRQKVLFRN